ncbi:cell division protein YceG involved in septum cleavage [Desulfitispora alkaliphila]|uniref:hypothetical protein n=1 Tax=Desulfitispora alkaliphila TaxID=622674 RepID=UPI003D2410B3
MISHLIDRRMMLGLGIGLIISALVFLLFSSPQKEQLSEEEIILRAETMGMVSQEKYREALEEVEREDKSKDKELVEIQIPNGTSTGNIATILKANNVIENEVNFVEMVYLLDLQYKLIAGTYVLPQEADSAEIILALTGNKE